MNRIKIFSGDDSKKLQKKVNRWTDKMQKKHHSAFKIGGTSLAAYENIGPEFVLTVIYTI